MNLRPFGPEPNALPSCATPRNKERTVKNSPRINPGGSDVDRTRDLYRVKVALIPTELRPQI